MAKKRPILDDSQTALLLARTPLAALGCELFLAHDGAEVVGQVYKSMVSEQLLMKVRTTAP